jgi:DNA-binding SARP family transcriptional activator
MSMSMSIMSTVSEPLIPRHTADAGGGVVLRLLGGFAIESGGRVSDDAAWRQRQTRHLLTLLGSAQHCTETRGAIQRELWPGFGEERARNRLHHTVHLVRKAWQELPQTDRPLLRLSPDRMTLELPKGSLLDIHEFEQWLDTDEVEPERRLDCVKRALLWYGGALAPDWVDSSTISARRQRLAGRHRQALEEAAALCVELGRRAEALGFARQRALGYPEDVQAQCDYALLLADEAQVDAALQHCTQCRDAAGTPRARATFDDLLRNIQQRSNLARSRAEPANAQLTPGGLPPLTGGAAGGAAAGGAPAALTPAAPAAAQPGPYAAPATGEPTAARAAPAAAWTAHEPPHDDSARARFAAPHPLRPLGYSAVLEQAEAALQDPFLSVVTLVGPPGAGKTLLAAELGRRFVERMRHGALWVAPESPARWLEALVQGCEQCFGPVQCRWDALTHMLAGKELLLVLDASSHGLGDDAEHLRRLAHAGAELRVLVATRQPLGLAAEKVVLVEPEQLLQTTDTRQASAAARICLGAAPRVAAHDAGLAQLEALEAVESIAAELGGLPALMTIGGHALERQSPGEFLESLRSARDDALQAAAAAGGANTLQLLARYRQWLAELLPQERHRLALMAGCRGWLTRADLHALFDDQPSAQTEAFLQQMLDGHYVCRRLRWARRHSWSEFQVPAYVRLALRAAQDDHEEHAQSRWRLVRRTAWLLAGPGPAPGVQGPAAPDVAAWIDARIEDFDAVARAWLDAGCHDEPARLCLEHGAAWLQTRRPEVAEAWLDALGVRMSGLPPAQAGPLLLLRSQLRVRLGHFQAAFEDAGSSLHVLPGDNTEPQRQRALRIIDRYGARSSKAPRPVWLTARGVDAGESLLRAAHTAAGRGDWPKALRACDQALTVFNYFGLARSQITAHQYRTHIAYCSGEAALAEECAQAAERSALALGDLAEGAKGLLMQGFAACAQMHFPRGAALALEVLALPEHIVGAATHARALLLLGWTHYGQGALPAARAVADTLRARHSASAEPWVRINSETLACLIDGRQGRASDALRALGRIAVAINQRQPIVDIQGALIDLVELAAALRQPQISAEALQALRGVAGGTAMSLRPWVRARAQALSGVGGVGAEAAPTETRNCELSEARERLAALIDRLLATGKVPAPRPT